MPSTIVPPPFLDKAQEAVRAAELLLEQGCHDSAANRAYYATFHAARAALVAAGLTAATRRWAHDALQSKFSELVRQRKGYPSHLKGCLMELLTVRELADYGQEMVSLRVSKSVVRQAAEFVTAIERRIAP